MVRLVSIAQSAQDRDGVLNARLADEYRLEATLQRGVLLDVLAVLVQRRRADGPQLAARQHRLQHVRGVHRPLGRTRADDGVQLVDEEDDLPGGVRDFLQHRFQALFELAAEFRTRDQRAQIEGDHPLVLEVLRHVAAHDALCQSLGDRRLPDAGLADQHRVVLRPPRENLHHAADLFIAADDRVELALSRQLGEVASILFQRLVLVLGVGIGHALPSANLGERLIDAVFRHTEARQQLCRPSVERVDNTEQQMLGADILVTHPLRFIFSRLQHLAQTVAGVGCAAFESFGSRSNSVAVSLRTAAGSTPSFLMISGTRPSD